RNSTSSDTSSLASSQPATSLKVTLVCSSLSSLARERPKLMAPLPPPCCICRIMKKKKPMISRTGRKLIRMYASDGPVDGGACLMSTPWFIRSSIMRSSRRGAITVPRAPSVRSNEFVRSSSAMSTRRIRLFRTSSMNCEYWTSCGPAVFGLKLWHTIISTMATTTQSSRFLTRSFIQFIPVRNGAMLLDMGALALCKRIDFPRALARRRRLADDDPVVAPPQFTDVLVEAHAVEQLDQESAARPQMPVGEIHGQFGQVHRPGLVHRAHATLVGGHVGQNKVHRLPVQRRLKRDRKSTRL